MGYINLKELKVKEDIRAERSASASSAPESVLLNIVKNKIDEWDGKVSQKRHYLVERSELSEIIDSLETYAKDGEREFTKDAKVLIERAKVLEIAIDAELLKLEFNNIHLMVKNKEPEDLILETKKQVALAVEDFYRYCMQQEFNMSEKALAEINSSLEEVLTGALVLDREWVSLLDQFSFHEEALLAPNESVAAWKNNQRPSNNSDARSASQFSGYAVNSNNIVAGDESYRSVLTFTS